MTAAEFQACIPLVQHLATDRVAAARAVLVDDVSQTEVALRYGWSRQAVNICVDKVWDALQSYRTAKRYEAEMVEAALPPGWTVAVIAAPSAMLEKIRADVNVAADAAGIDHSVIEF
jgi:hypothetical protein